MAEVGRGPGHEHQVRPGPGISLGDSCPDPPARAGDEGDVPACACAAAIAGTSCAGITARRRPQPLLPRTHRPAALDHPRPAPPPTTGPLLPSHLPHLPRPPGRPPPGVATTMKHRCRNRDNDETWMSFYSGTAERVSASSFAAGDVMSNLQGDDAAAFARLGIRAVYDMRTEAERTKQPNQLPPGTEYVVLDILKDSSLGQPGSGPPGQEE